MLRKAGHHFRHCRCALISVIAAEHSKLLRWDAFTSLNTELDKDSSTLDQLLLNHFLPQYVSGGSVCQQCGSRGERILQRSVRRPSQLWVHLARWSGSRHQKIGKAFEISL